MRHAIAAGAAFLIIALTAGAMPAAAKDIPAAGLANTDVQRWLQGHGYKAEIKKDATAKMDYVATASNGTKFNIYLYNCNHGVCTSLQYSANWEGGNVALAQINDWNNRKRFLRAYLTPQGAVFGEYDVDIAPGGTWEQLDQSLERWKVVMSQFSTFIRS